jgi:hypothetical protein
MALVVGSHAAAAGEPGHSQLDHHPCIGGHDEALLANALQTIPRVVLKAQGAGTVR